MDEERMARLLAFGEEIGLKFELTDGGITWETYPGIAHQEIVYNVQTSLQRGDAQGTNCDCYHGADVDLVLPDGTVKRPDVSVWCKRPSELEGFVHEVPEAVVEVVSPGYEAKDLVHGPPIYLRNGVKDVIVLDRAKGEVHHWTPEERRTVTSPFTFDLVYGCKITV